MARIPGFSGAGGQARLGGTLVMALRAIAFLGLLLALFLPLPAATGRDHFLILDVSASVRRFNRLQLEDLPGIVASAMPFLGPRDRVGLIAFGDTARQLMPLQEVDAFKKSLPRSFFSFSGIPGESGTHFLSALQLARSRIPSDRPGFLWVWTDGLQTLGDARPEIARLQAETLTLHSLGAPRSGGGDFQVRRVTLPRNVQAGSRVSAMIEVQGDAGEKVSGEFFVRLKSEGEQRDLDPLPFQLDPGEKRRWILPFDIPWKGMTLVELEARITAPDPVPENNRRQCLLAAADNLRRGWIGVGKVPGISMAPEQLGSLLPQLDFLFWNEPDPRQWQAAAPLLLGFLDRGGILFVAGGPTLFPREDEGLLPLVLDLGDGDPRDVLMLVDASGSMAGGKLEKALDAASILARALRPGDQLDAALFQAKLGKLERLKKAGRDSSRPWILPAARRHGQGATNLKGVLQAAIEKIGGQSESRQKVLLLITDGRQEFPGTGPGDLVGVGRSLKEAGIEVRAFAVGPDADQRALEHLTAQGENGVVRPVDSVADLPGVMAAEGATLYQESGGHRVLRQPNSSLPGLPERGPDLIWRTRAKLAGGAEAMYTNQEGKPILAWRSIGSGRVLALAAPLSPGAAPAWIENPEIVTSLSLSLPRSQARGTLEWRGDSVIYTPLTSWPERAEIRLRIGEEGQEISLFLQGNSYQGPQPSLPAATVDAILSSTEGETLDRIPLTTSGNPEWSGGGRKVSMGGARNPGPPPPGQGLIGREALILLALGILFLSLVLPTRPRSG